jgi:parvulin-like peptidyl-prolyl isomerase
MAVIGKIRQRSGLLIFLIGASIVGFLVMDATNSQFSVLKGRKDSIGKVNGEKITYNEFTKKYEENVKTTEDQMRGQQAMTDEQRNNIRTQTWNQMVNDIIFNKIYDKLGINVTADEMNELATGVNASPYIQQNGQFRNPQTGQFDPSLVRMYLSRLDQDPEGVEPGTVRRQWLNFETMLKQGQFQAKYGNLISKSFYVPGWMGEMTYNDQNRLVDFKYVQLPYTEVNDADVKVTDDDIKKFVDEHAARYKQDEETRKIDYVTFDIAASSGDSAKTVQYLAEKRADFASGKTPSGDSVFVKLYSETPFDAAYYEKDKVMAPASVKDSFFTVKVGSIVGPYIDNGSFKLAKISDRKLISDSVHVRDIAFSFAGITSQEQANVIFKQIDSIYKAIDSLHADFGQMAFNYSSDQASKMKGGDLGWVKRGEKEKAYNDLIFFHAQKGKVYKVPNQTENAIHLVQVIEDKPTVSAVLVSYLSKEIQPTPETERNIYSNATNFAADNQSDVKFKAAGQKLNMKTVNAVKKDAFDIAGLGSARDLIKWVYGAKKGDVSPVYTVEKKHVVALLEVIRPKGLPEIDALRDIVKPEVIRDKKFEILSKKVTDAKAANIDDLAAKLAKSVAEADKVSFARPALAEGAFEPKVVATALVTAVGKLSQPVKGNGGVYVTQTIAIQEPVKSTDYTMYTYQLKQQLQNKARFAQDVEKKLASIDDNRFDFF